ncbi:transporter [Streptomyces griseocarneus]|nr:transporter [Streptomyces griseocarneus]
MVNATAVEDRTTTPVPRRGLLAALGRAAVRYRRAVLALGLSAVAAAAWAGAGVSSHLQSGGWAPPTAPSQRADALLSSHFHGGTPDLVVLARASGSVDDPAARGTGAHLAERVRADPAVSGVDSYWAGPSAADPALRTKDGHGALLLVRLTGEARHTAPQGLLSAVTGRQGPLHLTPSGPAALTRDLQRRSQHDLQTSELIALPITLLLLVWAFGGVLAAWLPLAVGVAAIAGTLAVLRAVCCFTEVSVYALNWTTAAGLALAVDYSLFLVARYREERRAGADHMAAVERSMSVAGRTVVVSAGIVMLSLTGLLLFPLPFLRSMAYAGIPVVALAAIAALVLVPAGLSHRRRPVPEDEHRADRWGRLALAVMRHRVPVALATALVLGAFALPFRHAEFALSDERVLPHDAPAVTTVRELRTLFPDLDHTEVDVVLPRWNPAGDADRLTALDAYARRLSTLPGAASVRTATGDYVHGSRVPAPCGSDCAAPARRFLSAHDTWLAVHGPSEPFGTDTVRLARAVRASPAPVPPLVTGAPALLLDVRQAVADRLPWAVAIVIAATLALLLVFTRGIFLAAKAVVMNALSMTATFGVMVWIFQDGHLRHLLGGFTATGTVDLLTAITVFFLAFGLSMDYEVLLLARVVEAHDRTGDTRSAVASGLQGAAPLFTASAAVVSAVLLSLAGSGITTIKLIGVTVAVSVAVDALIIRPLLVPAVMALAGPANWWTPRLPRTGGRRNGPQAPL